MLLVRVLYGLAHSHAHFTVPGCCHAVAALQGARELANGKPKADTAPVAIVIGALCMTNLQLLEASDSGQ